MEKPFAITLDVGSSLANKTGSWRTERAGLRRPAAALQQRLPGRREHPAVALRRRGGRRRLRARLAQDHGGQPVPGRDGPGLLPPVRDGLQPRAARRGGRDQLGRALPRRRGDPAGLAGRGRPAPPSGKRVLVVGAGPSGLSAAYHLARLGHEVTIRDAGPQRRRDDALRDPAVPPAARGPRRRDPAHPRPRRRRSSSNTKVDDVARRRCARAASTPSSSPSARTSASAPTSPPARRPTSSTPSRCCAAWRARSRRCSAAASSSTAAATPRWTRRARRSGSAPRRRSSSTGARATGCPPTTSRSRRPRRRAS